MTGHEPQPRSADGPEGAIGSSERTHLWDRATRPLIASHVEDFEMRWRAAGDHKPDVAAFRCDDPDQDAALRLALLRADMALRWESGDCRRADQYFEQHQTLDADQRVALIYEEFCLREERGDLPRPGEYYTKFPELSERLVRVFQIHSLVGSSRSMLPSTSRMADEDALFPEVGETIGGFVLVEELGRGSFARVYLARERHLAHRPVALKLALNVSNEPQTLAQLQHTHIVPLHSYRSDAATGLHMLCMPYFGRVTLAHLLEKPEMKEALTGGHILRILDSFDPKPAAHAEANNPAPRRRFARLSFEQAIAFWGARLADALQYAHDQKVLHRDIKPSNVLITPDAMPMLLDFNLAQAANVELDASNPDSLGGTFPYMAPEHLEALAGSPTAHVDAQSDIFSLGVVLFEAMGARPFDKKPPATSATFIDALYQAASQRRRQRPRLQDRGIDASPAFEAVIQKCLASTRDQRYRNAAELAADLHALAEDRPLRHAHEPRIHRAGRWIRRNRVRLMVLAPLFFLSLLLGGLWLDAHLTIEALQNRATDLLADGRAAEAVRRPDEALGFFIAAEDLVQGNSALADLAAEARRAAHRARRTQWIQGVAANLFRDSGQLRFDLLGFGERSTNPTNEIARRLAPLGVIEKADWRSLPELALLDRETAAAVIHEVDELLFFWTVSILADARSKPEHIAEAATVCERALAFTDGSPPWRALFDYAEALRDGRRPELSRDARPELETSPWVCFQWGLIHTHLSPERPARARGWLQRSVELNPRQYWAQYFLGYHFDRERQSERALAHYNAAIALEPQSPWAVFSRARLSWPRNDWEQALRDLDRAIELAEARDYLFTAALLERGMIKQRLGDFAGAARDYEPVLEKCSIESHLGRAVRSNQALLDLECGRIERARAGYDALLECELSPGERRVVLASRVRQRARVRDWEGVEADIGELALRYPDDPNVLGMHASLLLFQGRFSEARVFAEQAVALDASPLHERVLARAALAEGRLDGVLLDDPEWLWTLPGDRTGLRADIARAATLHTESGPASAQSGRLLNRAVLLAALGDQSAVEALDRVFPPEGDSTRGRVVRARVRIALDDRGAAAREVEAGLARDPDDARLLEIKARLLLDEQRPREALVLLDQAQRSGMTPTLFATRARAFEAAGESRAAFNAWSQQLALDRENPELYLARARVARRMRLHYQVLADLESAASLATDRGDVLARITQEYSRCLRRFPDRRDRVSQLATRTLVALGRARARPAQEPE